MIQDDQYIINLKFQTAHKYVHIRDGTINQKSCLLKGFQDKDSVA